MKHKLIQLISVIIIAAFALQPFGFAQGKDLAWGWPGLGHKDWRISLRLKKTVPSSQLLVPSFKLATRNWELGTNLRPVAMTERPEEETLIDWVVDHGGLKGTRDFWDKETVSAEAIAYFEDLQRRLKLALGGRIKAAGLPTYGYITDMHGRFMLWKRHMAEMKKRGVDVIVVGGDTMDRGGSGVRIMEDIMERSKAQRIVYNIGNHERYFMRGMMGDEQYFLNWIHNGGSKTLTDAGIPKNVRKRVLSLCVRFFLSLFREEGLLEAMQGRESLLRAIKIARELDELSDQIGEIRKETKQLLDSDIANNQQLVRICRWLQNNGNLFYTDAYDTFCVHAGVPIDKDGSVSLVVDKLRNISALKEIEDIVIIRGLILDSRDPRVSIFSACTSMRGFEKLFEDEQKGQKLLDDLNALRIIRGHVAHSRAGPANTRLIDADIAGTAWVMVGPGGIHFMRDNRVVRKDSLPGKKFLAEVSEECGRRLVQLRSRSAAAQQVAKPMIEFEEAI